MPSIGTRICVSVFEAGDAELIDGDPGQLEPVQPTVNPVVDMFLIGTFNDTG